MDINIAIKKTMAYSLAAGLLTAFFVVLILASTKYLTGLAGVDELNISIFAALAIALLFNPLKDRIQKIIDKLFYKTTYNYYEVIQRVSRELSSKIFLKDIEKFIVELLVDTLKVKEAHFLLAGRKYYVTVYAVKPKDRPADDAAGKRQRIDVDGEVIKLLKERRDIVIREELPIILGQERADVISGEMASFRGEVAVPVVGDDELKAIIILGGKQSGDIFTDEDVNLLKTVSNETALSMKNAMLHAEKLRTEKLAAVGLTAASLAHEIKNPLSSIKTFSQLLPEKYADEDFRGTFSEIVPAEIQRIDKLVTELLTFARQAPERLTPEKIEITALVDEALKLFSEQCKESAIEVMTSYTEGLYTKGERDRLKQALINIIANSCQAMEQGGYLKVSTAFDDKIHIAIEDTGAGISEADMEKIFEPFYTTKATGSGLGLTISRKIIEDHGGGIGISSRVNRGTRVIVSLDPSEKVKDIYKGEEQPLLWSS